MNVSLNNPRECPQQIFAMPRRAVQRSSTKVVVADAGENRARGKTILERIAAGDKAAVQDCLDTYGGLVWSLARRYLRNVADAEDAVQDVFIAIWSAAAKYDWAIGSEVTFVGTIARRRLIDQIRKTGRRPATESLDNEDACQPQPVVAGCLEDSAEIAKVAAVLESMQPGYREILSMSLYEGYSHGEIASQLQIPLGTVKSRMRRGLMQVREQLQLAA